MIATAPPLDFEQLYTEYHSKIRAYIYKRTSDIVLSDDLTADVFLKAFDAARRGTEVENLSGWLYRIAHNLVIDTYRARDRHPTVDLEAIAAIPHSETTHERVMQTLDSETVRRALDRLTNDQAEVLELRYLDGYTFGEIAAMMGKSEGAVKATKMRALNTLCVLLGGDERPTREDGRQEAVAAALREYGPMTMREIMSVLNERKGAINYALCNCSQFVQVGTRPGATGAINVWGLVGLHDHDRRAA